MSKIPTKVTSENFSPVVAFSRSLKQNKSFSSRSDSLLKSFSKSPLALCSEEDMAQAEKIAQSLEAEKGLIFVFAMGGMGASGRVAGAFSSNKKVFHINSLDENSLSFLKNLKKDQLRKGKWIFISKSGATLENLFYLHWMRELYLKRGLKPVKGQIHLLTDKPDSPLGLAVKGMKGSLLKLRNPLPGRFSFFTLSGFLQARLMGLDLKLFSEGFKQGCRLQSEREKALLFFLKFLREGEKCFLLVDSSFDLLARWFATSWAESLSKSKVPGALRVLSFSDLFHGYLEEVSACKTKAFVMGLKRSSTFKDLNSWERERERVLQSLLERSAGAFLFFHFPGKKDFTLGYLISFFFQVIHGAGKEMKADIYTQPSVDNFKRLFHNYKNYKIQTQSV